MLRLIFECRHCATRYLPPLDMRYADGSAASAVWCSSCRTAMTARGVEEPPGAAAVAMPAATMALNAFRAADTQAADAPPARRALSTPARTSRSRTGPGKARSRLH